MQPTEEAKETLSTCSGYEGGPVLNIVDGTFICVLTLVDDCSTQKLILAGDASLVVD